MSRLLVHTPENLAKAKTTALCRKIEAFNGASQEKKKIVVNLVKAGAYDALGEIFFRNFLMPKNWPHRKEWKGIWDIMPGWARIACEGY